MAVATSVAEHTLQPVTASVKSAGERRELLKQVYEEARGCTACALHQTRTTVVFGAGDADAELMFIGEGPGANEDAQGLPFVGRAGKLLDTLLAEIELTRGDVFIANVVKCRPPGNRDPHPNEIESCHHYLRDQVQLIQPTVICTLGNFATKLLREDPTGISRLHGQAEVRTIGGRAIRLLALYHPAAALYTPSTLQTLRDDFAHIPGLLAEGAPPQPDPNADPDAGADAGPPDTDPEPVPEVEADGLRPVAAEPVAPEPAEQMGLF